MPRVIGGRYGLSSQGLHAGAWSRRCSTNCKAACRKNGFTVGINDDVTPYQPRRRSGFTIEPERRRARGVLRPGRRRHGRRQQEQRQDHRRGRRPLCAGLFRLRLAQVGRADDLAPALRSAADPCALSDRAGRASSPATSSTSSTRQDVLRLAAPGATFLLNSPYGPDEVWDQLPRPVQQQIIDKQAALLRDRRVEGRPRRRPARPHQHHPADLLLRDLRRAAAEDGDRARSSSRSARPTAARARRSSAENFAAVDGTLARLFEVKVPAAATSRWDRPPMRAGRARPTSSARSRRGCSPGCGDDIPVSLMPVDGTFPSGTSAVREAQHRRHRAGLGAGPLHPVRPVQLRLSARRHPRAVLRRGRSSTARRTPSSRRRSTRAAIPDARFTLQFYVEDCTGCGLCVEACPAHSPIEPDTQGDQPARQAAADR